MKAKQQKQQLLKLRSLAISVTMVILLGSTTPVFSSISVGNESELDASQARKITHINYISDVAQRVVNYLTAWRVKYKYAAPVDALEEFTGVMLMYGNDPVIAGIYYVPEQNFTIYIRDDAFVEPQLQDKISVYYFQAETSTLSTLF